MKTGFNKNMKHMYLLCILFFLLFTVINCDNGSSDSGDNESPASETTWYLDSDNDGYGTPDEAIEAELQPEGYVNNNKDCDDGDADINPEAAEICRDGIDNNCDGKPDCADPDCSALQECSACTDEDSDGYFAISDCGTEIDCNDSDAAIHPGMQEECNGIDDNCNGDIDEACDSVVYPGFWAGSEISFTVDPESNGITGMSVSYSGYASGSYCSFTYDRTTTISHISIVGNSFSYNGAELDLSGTFVSNNQANVSISWSGYDSYCYATYSGHKSFTAVYVPNPCRIGDVDVTATGPAISFNNSVDITASLSAVYSSGCVEGIPDNTEVEFTISDPDNTGSTISSQSAMTNDGAAKITLNAGNASGEVTITASAVDDEGNTLTDNVTITIENPCEPVKPSLTASSPDILINSGSTVITASIPVSYPDECADGLPNGTQVQFLINSPDSTGSTLSDSSVTTNDGQAQVTLAAGSNAGIVTVIATVTDSNGNTYSESIDVAVSLTIASMEILDTLPSYTDIYISGDYAYIAVGQNGLKIINISDPADPFIEGGYEDVSVRSVTINEPYAYMACGTEGITVLDITDPSLPVFVGANDLNRYAGYISGGSTGVDLGVLNSYAFVADTSFDYLKAVDISNPSSSLTVPYALKLSDQPASIDISGDRAYVKTTNFFGSDIMIDVIDISDPENLNKIDSIDIDDANTCLYVSAFNVFTADSSGDLRMIDTSDPTAPENTDLINIEGTITGIYVIGPYLYTAVSSNYWRHASGFDIVDISDPASCEIICSSSISGRPRNLEVNGSYAYIVTESDLGVLRLKILDISSYSDSNP